MRGRNPIACAILLLVLVVFTSVGNAQQLVDFNELYQQGVAQLKAENYEEAVELLTRAREKQLESSQAAFYLGLAQKQTGNMKEAQKNYLDALKYKPEVKDAYLELAEISLNLKNTVEAMKWINKAEQENVNPANTAFLKGEIYVQDGNLDEGIEYFKKAKALDPNLTQSADFRIAMAYAKQNRLSEARELLRSVTTISQETDISSFAKEYEATITKAIDSHRSWRLTAGLAYMFDDNVYAKPSKPITGMTFTDKKEDSSTVGTFKLDYTPMPSGPWIFNAQYSAYENYHYKLHSYDILSQALTLTPGYNFQSGLLTAAVAYNYVMLDDKSYLHTFSLKPTYSILLPYDSIGQIFGGYTKRVMDREALIPEENRTGELYNAGLGYIYTFEKGKGMASLRYEFTKEGTEGPNWESTWNKLSAGLVYPFVKQRINLIVSGEVSLNDFQNVNTVFEKKRRDRLYVGSIGASWEILAGKGLNLNVQYSYTRADSNIAVYDYKRNTAVVGLEYIY